MLSFFISYDKCYNLCCFFSLFPERCNVVFSFFLPQRNATAIPMCIFARHFIHIPSPKRGGVRCTVVDENYVTKTKTLALCFLVSLDVVTFMIIYRMDYIHRKSPLMPFPEVYNRHTAYTLFLRRSGCSLSLPIEGTSNMDRGV